MRLPMYDIVSNAWEEIMTRKEAVAWVFYETHTPINPLGYDELTFGKAKFFHGKPGCYSVWVVEEGVDVDASHPRSARYQYISYIVSNDLEVDFLKSRRSRRFRVAEQALSEIWDGGGVVRIRSKTFRSGCTELTIDTASGSSLELDLNCVVGELRVWLLVHHFYQLWDAVAKVGRPDWLLAAHKTPRESSRKIIVRKEASK